MAVQGNIGRPFDALFKNKGNERRDARVRYRAAFSILWDENSSQPKYAKAFCNEVSEHGLSLETPQSIPVGTQISLRSESGSLFGGACVKHAAQRGSIYILGVELGYSLLDEALALVREVYSTPHAKQ